VISLFECYLLNEKRNDLDSQCLITVSCIMVAILLTTSIGSTKGEDAMQVELRDVDISRGGVLPYTGTEIDKAYYGSR
jgi:hypothetical protein